MAQTSIGQTRSAQEWQEAKRQANKRKPAAKPTISAADIFATLPPAIRAPAEIFYRLGQASDQPQGQNEPNAVYGVRSAVTAPVVATSRGIDAAAADVSKAVDHGLDTPAKAAERQRQATAVAPGSVFPESYSDPAYDAAERYASQLTGVPAELIRAARMNGERSNASQVSPAGARTPYQIIPGTRSGIQKNYKIDPWSNPQNAALGAAYVLWEQAGRPRAGQWTPEHAQRAIGGYFAGAAGAANPFRTDIGDGNLNVGQYTQRVLGNGSNLPAPLINPFDPAQANKALNYIDQAGAAAKQPSSFNLNVAAPPEPPKPEPLPTADFSEAKARLEAMRPVEMSLKQEKDIHWKNFWGGLGKAMASSPEGEGIGSLFLRMGGGALMAKGATGDEIQQRRDMFDQKMSRWQAAMYEHDFQTAQVSHQDALRQWQADANWADNKYKVAADQYARLNNFSMQGNNLVQVTQTPEGAKVNIMPVGPMIDAMTLYKKADVAMSMFSGQNSANAQVTGYANKLLTAQAAQTMMATDASPQERAAASLVAPVRAVDFIVDNGQLGNLMPPEELESLTDRVGTAARAQGLLPGTKEHAEFMQRSMKTELVNATVLSQQGDSAFYNKVLEVGKAADLFRMNEALEDTRRRVTQGPRGTSVTTTAPAEVFGEDY